MKYIKSYKIFENSDEESSIECNYLLEFVLEELQTQLVNEEIYNSFVAVPNVGYTFLFRNRILDFKYVRRNFTTNLSEYIIKYDEKIIFKGVDYEEDLIPSVWSEFMRLKNNLNRLIGILSVISTERNKLGGIPFKEISDRLEEFEVIKDYQIDYISLENLYDFYNAPFDKKNFDLKWNPKK